MNQDTHVNSPTSIAGLLHNLRDLTTTLLRQEVQLAKAEVGEKVSSLGRDVAQIAIGGVIAFAGALLLLFGISDLVGSLLLRAGLDADVAQWVARLAVGLIVALVGGLLLLKAKKAMSRESLVPEKTVETLKQDKQWAQNKLEHSHT
jgi:hypothetical protein